MKKHNAVFALVGSIFLAFSCFTMKVQADSYDRQFRFIFTDIFEGRITGPQTKDNDSSVYMWYSSGSPHSYDAKVIAFTNPNAYEWTDCSGGYHYRFYRGQKRFMYNYVKENGHSTAGVYGYHQSSAGTASGYWSPDSVYESGVLPASDYLK